MADGHRHVLADFTDHVHHAGHLRRHGDVADHARKPVLIRAQQILVALAQHPDLLRTHDLVGGRVEERVLLLRRDIGERLRIIDHQRLEIIIQLLAQRGGIGRTADACDRCEHQRRHADDREQRDQRAQRRGIAAPSAAAAFFGAARRARCRRVPFIFVLGGVLRRGLSFVRHAGSLPVRCRYGLILPRSAAFVDPPKYP